MNKLNKNTVETIKTVVIAVLVTAIVAFVLGMKYQSHNTAQTQRAVEHAVDVHQANSLASKN